MTFIDQQRPHYRVESICAALTELGCQIAPRTYRSWKTRAVAGRTVTDAIITDRLRDTIGEPEGLYGRRKMVAHLRREGLAVAECTVDRLMRDEGLSGVLRGRVHRTTIPAKDGVRAGDQLNRDFTAEAPNQRWVADFTYCRTWSGFVYVAFVIDCYSRAIVGWHASTTMTTPLVTAALRMALWRRDHTGHPVGDGLVHHSDAGSQYTSIHFTETLTIAGITASIGSVGDAYDNALAESTIGLFKTECFRRGSPFHAGPFTTIADVEYATLGWVDWYNQRRLHSTLGNIPPEEYEANHYRQITTPQPAVTPV